MLRNRALLLPVRHRQAPGPRHKAQQLGSQLWAQDTAATLWHSPLPLAFFQQLSFHPQAEEMPYSNSSQQAGCLGGELSQGLCQPHLLWLHCSALRVSSGRQWPSLAPKPSETRSHGKHTAALRVLPGTSAQITEDPGEAMPQSRHCCCCCFCCEFTLKARL